MSTHGHSSHGHSTHGHEEAGHQEMGHEHAEHVTNWVDLYGPGLVALLGIGYILLCALWSPKQ